MVSIVPFRVLCVGRQDSTSKPLVIPLYVILYSLRASSCCKHDVGTLSWLNAETVERAPTPLFGRLLRCSAHGPFFGRLRYMHKYTFIAGKNTTLLHLTSHTVDYSNFFDFGVDAGDTRLNRIDDGSSPPFSLPLPIQFFERSQSTIYVSWFCILTLCTCMYRGHSW